MRMLELTNGTVPVCCHRPDVLKYVLPCRSGPQDPLWWLASHVDYLLKSETTILNGPDEMERCDAHQHILKAL
jgi:hypothetical protein